MPKNKKRNLYFLKFLVKHSALFVILILIILGMFYSFSSEGIIYSMVTVDPQVFTDFLNSFGALSVVVFVLLVILEVVIAPLHPAILYLVGGFLFGGFLGGTLILIGNMIGSYFAFMIARKYGRRVIERIDRNKREKFDRFTEKHGALATFLLRINPITNSDLINYLAGASKVKLSGFLIATFISILPFSYLGSYLGGEVVRGSPFLIFAVVTWGVVYMVFLIYVFVYSEYVYKKNPSKR